MLMEEVDFEKYFINAVSEALNQIVAKFCLNHVVFTECVQLDGFLTVSVDKWDAYKIPIDKIFLNVPVEGSNASFYVMNATCQTKQQCNDLVYSKALNEIKKSSLKTEVTQEACSTCSVCFMRFKEVTVMINHFQDVHGAITYSVQSTPDSGAILVPNPQAAFWAKQKQCRICKKSVRKKDIIQHIIKEHGTSKTKKFKCRYCSRIFLFELTRSRHEYALHRSHYLKPKFNDDSENETESEIQNTKYEVSDANLVAMTTSSTVKETPAIDIAPEEYCVECCLNSNKCKHKSEKLTPVETKVIPEKKEIKEEKDEKEQQICALCKKQCRSSKALFQHIRISHMLGQKEKRPRRSKPKFECPQCHAVFFTKAILRNHEIDVHLLDDESYKCGKCEKSYTSEKALFDHIRYKHEIDSVGDFKCSICNGLYKSKASLRSHIRYKHPDKFEAKPRNFLPKISGGKNILQCEVCKVVLKDNAAFRYHFFRHIETQTNIACEVAGCDFIAQNYLADNVHLKTHDISDEYACDSCDETFVKPHYLRFHRLKNHRKYKLRQFECSLCNRVYTGKQSLNKHLAWHRGEKIESVKCEICGKLIHKSYIATHRRIHTGDKPYKCKFCPQTFMYHNTWARHEKHFHKCNKINFTCKICCRSFVREDRYKLHLAAHEGSLPKLYVKKASQNKAESDDVTGDIGDKRFKCKYCSRRFVQRTTWAKHEHYYHMSDKPNFMCPICGLPFIREDEYKFHLAAHKSTLQDSQSDAFENVETEIEAAAGDVTVDADYDQGFVNFHEVEEELLQNPEQEFQTGELDEANEDIPRSLLVEVENGTRYLISANTFIQAPDDLQFVEASPMDTGTEDEAKNIDTGCCIQADVEPNAGILQTGVKPNAGIIQTDVEGIIQAEDGAEHDEELPINFLFSVNN